MQVVNRDGSRAARAHSIERRIDRCECCGPIAGVDGDTELASSRQSGATVDTIDRGAASSWFSLVAGILRIAEVRTTGALKDIPSQGSHIAQLLRCAAP